MTTGYNFFSALRQSGLSVKKSVRYFFGFLFAFLFAWQQTSALAYNTATSKKGVVLLSTSANSSHVFPFQFPFNPAPSPQGEDSADENELQEDVDDDGHALGASTPAEIVLESAFTNLFNRTGFCGEHHVLVPLFVLHHSWKTYLS